MKAARGARRFVESVKGEDGSYRLDNWPHVHRTRRPGRGPGLRDAGAVVMRLRFAQRLTMGFPGPVDAAGVAVTRHRPEPPEPRAGLAEAVGRALDGLEGDYAIAYSGGLASAFIAVSALAAGHRPVLLHADFGSAWGERSPTVPPPIPGLETRYVRVDPAELFTHEPVSGREPVPPMPDREVPLRLMARLSDSCGLPVVSGGLLKDLVSARLPEADAGYRGWRLLGCEPFHITDTLSGLAEARELLSHNVVFSPALGGREVPDEQPAGKPAPPRPTGAAPLPGLTRAGEEALSSSRHGMLALWKDHLDFLDPVSGRVVAGLEERGAGGALLPALDPQVIAAVAALPPAAFGLNATGEAVGAPASGIGTVKALIDPITIGAPAGTAEAAMGDAVRER